MKESHTELKTFFLAPFSGFYDFILIEILQSCKELGIKISF